MKSQMERTSSKEYTATKNACKLCAPLGASLVFKGIAGAVPLLHGSQGCSTYIRRYLISHYREPIDIACSNFAEETAIFGGGANLKIALQNIHRQYSPSLVGIATTCLSETIGDDVPMFIREYAASHPDESIAPLVHVSTPSYQGTHMQGFHNAVLATVKTLAVTGKFSNIGHVNIFPGMVSPADLRYLKEILIDFNLPFMMLPDYSRTLDGSLWPEYQLIPEGGTTVEMIRCSASAAGSLEFGRILSREKQSAGKWLQEKYGVDCRHLGLPVGITETDRFFQALEVLSGRPTPEKYQEERGRLIDSYVDSHKHVMSAKVAVYGEEDLVVAMTTFFSEIGILPVICASGDRSGYLKEELARVFPDDLDQSIRVMDNADFVDIESAVQDAKPDLIVGNSKGYAMSRSLGIPMVRIGFPIHDRVDASRRLHLGYRGTQQLFDRIANKLIEYRQLSSTVGYTYM
ncbi:MAG: nitrogenase component 1 [Pseudomonadota bacterium]